LFDELSLIPVDVSVADICYLDERSGYWVLIIHVTNCTFFSLLSLQSSLLFFFEERKDQLIMHLIAYLKCNQHPTGHLSDKEF